MKADRYTRPMTADMWWTFGTSRRRGTQVQLCVEGSGSVDVAALEGAVAAASQACPGARLVRRGRLWVDSGRAPAVRVVEAADFDRVELDSPVLRSPLTGEGGGASTEVVLVRGTPCTLIFRAHRSVMDGRGLMLWQREVFRALRGETLQGAPSCLTNEEVKAQIASGLGFEPPTHEGKPDGPEWRSALGRIPTGPRRSLWRRRTIDGTHPGGAARIARQVALCAGGEGRIEFTVDLRRLLPDVRITGGASGVIPVHVREDDDWARIDAALLTGLSEHHYLRHVGDPAVRVMPLALVRDLRAWIDTVGRLSHDMVQKLKLADSMAIISHLGVVDLADFSGGGFEATSYYCLGGIGQAPEVDVVESGLRTEVTVSWRGGRGVAERADALLDRIEEEFSPRAWRVWEGNRTGRVGELVPLTELFAGQVAAVPEAVAVAGGGQRWSYAELGARSGQVAAVLAARGVGRGDRVGLVAGRSAAAIAAIWGILRAGAAYLPIDEGYPDARVRGLLADAGARVCLLEEPNAGRDVLPAGCAGISLDEVGAAEAAGPGPAGPGPDDVACIIYTSGSTGTPKGVEITHRNLVNYVRWVTREAGISAATKMPLIASISFDMAGCAIFLPLLAGGTVLPVREVNAATLREVIEDGGATAMAITPSHLELINSAGVRRSSMRVVMTAGELLRRVTAVRAQKVFGPQCRILCQWGPTETTIVNTSHEFDPDRDTGAGVPFGRPLDNNTVFLLDERGRFVAPGEPGEAYVGGDQVARGYLGRPELTRQRFTRLADGTRVYRTGDIARLLPSGDLAFVARIDDQVKVSGHRIEPAEVAQALEDHPGVGQAVVLARSRPGRTERELCGYVTGGPGLEPAALKEFLAGRLPGYMVPAAIMVVGDIPRTANGKTDARQLPDPFTASPAAGPAAAGPGRDPVTGAVAQIWAATLGLDPHAIDEQADFRQLGGNSLLMLSMIDEVAQTVTRHGRPQFMAELPAIIREPTLGHIAAIARKTRTRRPRLTTLLPTRKNKN
jgi:amino acid adenylation domain-containing protein